VCLGALPFALEERTMFGLKQLTSAVAALAGNLLALAGTVNEVNVVLRARAGLDAPEPALGLPEPAPAEGGDLPARRNSRARTTA
jgi:hypothetical protein